MPDAADGWSACHGLPRQCVPRLVAHGEQAALACVLNTSARPHRWRRRWLADVIGAAQDENCGCGGPNCNALPLPQLTRWHAQTQERLFAHLRDVWVTNTPRIMVDLGSHAGHGPARNQSDATLWLLYFGADGGTVLGVDAIEDNALDLQHRFDHVEPFASMHGVRRVSLQAAISLVDNKLVEMSHIFHSSVTCCAGMWCGWRKQELAGATDHYCRITRQRIGACRTCGGIELLNASKLPTPPSSYPSAYAAVPAVLAGNKSLLPGGRLRYRVPTVRMDTLWRRELGGRTIDFLKIDLDMPVWQVGGIAELLALHAVRVMVIEVDSTWEQSVWCGTCMRRERLENLERLKPRWNLSQADELSWYARSHGYETLLKVPCRARNTRLTQQADALTSAWYYPLAGPDRPFVPSAVSPATMGGHPQDLLLLDVTREPSLQRLMGIGAASCRTPGRPENLKLWAQARGPVHERNQPSSHATGRRAHRVARP